MHPHADGRGLKTRPLPPIPGPRQSGKTTLCRALFPDRPYANLESQDVRNLALTDPRAFLASYPRGAVIDEIQRCPDLPSWLQPLIDEDPKPGRWILTGSQNLLLLESISRSLAGRTSILHLAPFSRSEIRCLPDYPESLDETLWSGSYPAIFDRGIPPADWYASYVSTYVERDIRTITNVGDLVTFQRFLSLCAGRTAQLLNLSSLAGDAGISQPTARSWLSILETGFLAFRLTPYRTNLRKRVVKMPKLHFLDTGLVCWLLGIRTPEQLRNHPLRGPIFETWVVSEIVKHRWNRGERAGVHYFRDRHGSEVDVVVELGDHIRIVEVRAGRTITEDMLRAAMRAAGLLAETGSVSTAMIHGGDTRQSGSDLTILPWEQLDAENWMP